MSALDQDLRAGAEKVSEGRIRIDARRALEKLRDHRLADPHHYVLELLRGAVASGATLVEVSADADDFELRFTGKGFPPEVIRELLSHALTGAEDEGAKAARFLALGVAGALGLTPSFVKVAAGGLLLQVRPPVEVEVKEGDGELTASRVHVKERVSWRVMRDLVAGPTELAVIQRAVRQFPVPLLLNQEPFQRGALFDEPVLARVEKQVGNARLVVAVPARKATQSSLTLDIYGVEVVTRRLELPLLQVVAWARDDRLRRNASGSDVVDGDPAFEQLKRTLEATVPTLVSKLIQELEKKDHPAVRGLLRTLCLDAAEKRKAKLGGSIRELLDKAPILPGPSGEWLSVAQLRAELNAGRQLRFSRKPCPAGSYTGPAVLLDEANQELETLLPSPPRVNVEGEVDARRKGAERKAAWEASPVERAALPAGEYLARAPIQLGNLRGEVGFPAPPGRSWWRFLSMGRQFQVTEPTQLEPLKVQVVLDLARPLPDRSWMELPIPLETGKALSAVREAAVQAVIDALAAAPEPSPELRRLARDLLVHLARQQDSVQLGSLPQPLREARVFFLAGGGWSSLSELKQGGTLRYIPSTWPNPSLSGNPVVVLETHELPLFQALMGRDRVKDYQNVLSREADVRSRRAGSRELARVSGPRALVVEFEEEGLHGEVGIPLEGGSGLSLRLLRDGVLLEKAMLTARYEVATAAVECPSLTPDELWRHARRDATFHRVLDAVRAAERRLVSALLLQHPSAALHEYTPGPRRLLTSFLRKELAGFARKSLDPTQQLAVEAPLFKGPQAAISLRQIAEACQHLAKLPILERPPREHAQGVFFVIADRPLSKLLSSLLDLAVGDAQPEVTRALARAEFRRRPEKALALPEALSPRAWVEGPLLKGLLAYDRSLGRDVHVELLLERRSLGRHQLDHPLPIRAVLELAAGSADPAAQKLSLQAEAALAEAAVKGEAKLIESALANPGSKDARELLLRALGSRRDQALPDEGGKALAAFPLLPTTDGRLRSARDLDGLPKVFFVTKPLSGGGRDGEPVVIADDPWLQAALGRWSLAIEVTDTFQAEQELRRQREALPRADRVEVSGPVLLRQSLSDEDLEGELALVAQGGGRLELLHDRRALCTLEEPWIPSTLAVAVNCDGLTVNPFHRSVVQDGVFDELKRKLVRQVEVFAAHAGKAWDALPPAERLAATAPLANLALTQWVKKKSNVALAGLPLLESSSGAQRSLLQLVSQHRNFKRVRWSSLSGSPLEEDSWIWRPRPGELELLAKANLKLVDGTSDLRRAQEVRERPRVQSLAAPIQSRWREPVTGAGLEGEVALSASASGKLELDVLFERTLLETLELAHPVGGTARVNGDGLRPAKEWTRAVRNQQFRELRDEVERALERLVARYLMEGSSERGWRSYVVAAAHWDRGPAGPLALALPRLVLFRDLREQPVSYGEVLVERQKRRRLAVAAPELPHQESFPGLLLQGDAASRSLLDELGIEWEDVSGELRRKQDVEASRQARRLGSLQFLGDALVRRKVEGEGFRGELVLPLQPAAQPSVTLARGGVAVCAYQDGGVGLAGVIDHPELPVNSQWTEAQLTPPMRRAIADEVAQLFGDLATLEPRLDAPGRHLAARYALRYLSSLGVSSPAQLDPLSGVSAALASMKLFRTCDGRWVDLRAVGARVLRRGLVVVVKGALDPEEVDGDVVLEKSALAAVGQALEQVLGRGSLEDRTCAQWRSKREEEDPEEGSLLHEGLAMLRRESKVLKSGSLGRLTTDELKQIRLRRHAKRPIRYDQAREVITLDADDPLIRRALEEGPSRPDRIYVLLSAIYGEVNRALERITDHDEARLVGGLMGHLAANPSLLKP